MSVSIIYGTANRLNTFFRFNEDLRANTGSPSERPADPSVGARIVSETGRIGNSRRFGYRTERVRHAWRLASQFRGSKELPAAWVGGSRGVAVIQMSAPLEDEDGRGPGATHGNTCIIQ